LTGWLTATIIANTMFLSVIVPAFNEEARLESTLLSTVEYFDKRCPDDYELLIVNDGSTDKTAHIAASFAKKHPQTQLLEYGRNRGKGYAVRYGMLHSSGDWRLFCDADLATPIEEFDTVFDAMTTGGAPIGIGSRPLRQSHLLVHQPWYRELMGRSFNKVVQLLAVPGIQDTQCGFKIFRSSVALDVFSRCILDLYIFDAEVLYIATKLGYKIAEVPIRWAHKDGSKVNMLRDGSRMVIDLLRIRALHRKIAAKIESPQQT
jgi:dolichyl-phosphate beta-glucosyltransferase